MKLRNGLTEFWKIVLLVISLVAIIYIRHLDKVPMFENVSWETRGYLYFFFVPVWLWAAGTFFIRRDEKSAKVWAFIAGSDNRLSLSRLQAFAWTLVIFGSFAAAIGIHTKISPVTAEQAKVYRNDADFAAKQVERSKANLEKAEAALKSLEEQENPAQADLDKAQAKLNDAQTAWSAADAKHATVQNLANSLNWVVIPVTLLALAGIAIGSGIFSSLISAVNSEEKSACVTDIKPFDFDKTEEKDEKGNVIYPPVNKTGSKRILQIIGRDMGKSGRVRFGKGRIYSVYAPILFWRADGTEIIVDVPQNSEKLDTLVVDTPNGKLCYELTDNSTDSLASFTLRNSISYYEFSDLFRDDKNPSSMDLMKFQMFGWTIVAIVVYCYLFLNDLRTDITSLPVVPQSIVILTGLSQAGYLAGKGISNTPANERSGN